MKRPSEINIVIGISIFMIVLMVTYWTLWFAVPGVVQSRTPGDSDFAIYSGYELAFPLPDGMTIVAALIGLIGLWKMKDWGFLGMLLAGGCTLFLGFEDLLFDLENHMFVPFNGSSAIEMVAVLCSLAMPSVAIILLWKQRKQLIK